MAKSTSAKNNVISSRFTNEQLDRIAARANALGMTRTAYIEMSANAHQSAPASTTISVVDPAKILIHKELRQQSHHLDRIAKGINTANLTESTFNNYQRLLSEIRDELAKLGAKL